MFTRITTARMLSTAATMMASTPCLCALLHSASSRSRYLHIRCMGLIKKLWNHSLKCRAAVATGASDTGQLVPGLCCMAPELGIVNMVPELGIVNMAPELGMVNTVACESCGRSGAGSCGGGVGLAGRLRGARSVPLGAGTQMGLRACHMRGPRREGLTEVGGWVNERTGEWEWVAGQTSG